MTFASKELISTSNVKIGWDSLSTQSKFANYLVSLDYARFQNKKKRKISSFLFQYNNKYVAGAHYSLQHLFSNSFTVADLRNGILFKGEIDICTYEDILYHYLTWAKHNNVSYARVNTLLPKRISDLQTGFSVQIARMMSEHGFKETTQPRHTYWIDLTQSEDIILQNMKRQTRYDARQEHREGITIEQYNEPNADLLKKFSKMYFQLGSAKGFHTIKESDLIDEITILIKYDLASIFVVRYFDTIVNISIVSHYGRAQYIYGAINPDYKNLKGCPPPGPIAQWAMIKAMKQKGLNLYDLGFCPGPIPIPDHPRYSIWRFKYGFGGQSVEFLPEYGKIIKPVSGRIFYFMRYKKLS